MATKPLTSPRLWATNALYTTGPFIGQPGKVDPGVGVAAEGHRPGSAFPTPAEFENSQQNRITDWVTNWLRLGTSDPDPDPHVVETGATGRAGLHGLDVINTAGETVVTVTGNNTLAPTVLVTCSTGATLYQADAGTGGGTCYLGSATSSAGTVFDASLFSAGAGAAGVRVTCDATSGGQGIVVVNNGLGRGVRLTNNGNVIEAMLIESFSAVSRGLHVLVNSAADAILGESGQVSGNAIRGNLRNNLGFALHGVTPASSTSTARAVRAQAAGDATGIESTSVSGPALQLQATNLAAPALVIVGKTADLTVPFDARLDFNTTTRTWITGDAVGGECRDFWTSRGGSVIGAGINNSTIILNSAGVWTTGAQLVLTGTNAPRRGGRTIALRFSCTFRSFGNNASLSVRIRDANIALPGGVIITRNGAGSGSGSGYFVTGATADWSGTVVLDVEYTVPAAGDRTFVGEVTISGANSVAVRDCSLVPFAGLY